MIRFGAQSMHQREATIAGNECDQDSGVLAGTMASGPEIALRTVSGNIVGTPGTSDRVVFHKAAPSRSTKPSEGAQR